MKKSKSNEKNHNMKGIPLVVTYHPLLKSLSAIITQNLSILHVDKEMEKVFTPPRMVSFRSARKLNSYLVRAKLYPLERTVGSYKYMSKYSPSINIVSAPKYDEFRLKIIFNIKSQWCFGFNSVNPVIFSFSRIFRVCLINKCDRYVI